MSKGLEALERLYSSVDTFLDYYTFHEALYDKQIIEKELKLLQLIKSRGIILRIPENEYSKEHFDIHIYTNTMSFEEMCEFEEIMLWIKV